MNLDLHIHTKYSFDSVLRPSKIIEVAKIRGLNGVAVTDHNTIQGGIETNKSNKDSDFLVIIGAEINTDVGDIIGLFLSEDINFKKSMEVIDEIKDQGGIAVLPHPCRGHQLNKELMGAIDIIEGFNSRSNKTENERAKRVAEKYDKPVIAGSDAHFASEIGSGITTINNRSSRDDIYKLLLNGYTNIGGNMSPLYLQSLSQIIKSIKIKDYRTIPLKFINLIMNMVVKREKW